MYMYITLSVVCIPFKQICWSGANSNTAGFKDSGLGSELARHLWWNNSQSACNNCANEPDESRHSSEPKDQKNRVLKQLHSLITISLSTPFATKWSTEEFGSFWVSRAWRWVLVELHNSHDTVLLGRQINTLCDHCKRLLMFTIV